MNYSTYLFSSIAVVSSMYLVYKLAKPYIEFEKVNKMLYEVDNENKEITKNSFVIDRFIDGDCYEGKDLRIGINGKVNPNNIYGHQGIRLGEDGNIKRLISFNKTENSLVYNFEDNTNLTLIKNNDKIIYSFKTSDIAITKEMNNDTIKLYKKIDMFSSELDKIDEIIKQN